jgi:hypothetical protein
MYTVPTSSSGVVGVNVNGDVGMLLPDGVHQDGRSPRLQQPSHILRERKNEPTAEHTEGVSTTQHSWYGICRNIVNFMSGSISSLCFENLFYLFARILNAPRLGLPEF